MSDLKEELSSLKRRIFSLEKDRTRRILKLGEIKYGEMRGMEIDGEEVQGLVADIQVLDQDLFACKFRLEEIAGSQSELFCAQCEGTVTPEDRFCKECGNPVNQEEKKEEALGTCDLCSLELMNGDSFCPRCGSRV